MKIDLSSWHDSDLQGRKLPKEDEITDFFDCFDTSPRDLSESFSKAVINHSYDQDVTYHSRTSEFPLLTADSYFKQWITPGLSNLDHSVPLSNSENSLVRVDGYENIDLHGRTVPSLAMTLDEEVIERIRNSSVSKCLNTQNLIRSSKDMSIFVNRANSFINSFLSHEVTEFKRGLKLGNYIQKLNHMDILAKIEKLREAHPIEPIYIVGKHPLIEYLSAHCPKPNGQILPNTYLVLEQSNRHRYTHVRDTEHFKNYESAIFTTQGMKGNHEFEINWRSQRGNRQWTIYLSILGKLGMDIPKDPTESNEILRSTPPEHSRWGTLF